MLTQFDVDEVQCRKFQYLQIPMFTQFDVDDV